MSAMRDNNRPSQQEMGSSPYKNPPLNTILSKKGHAAMSKKRGQTLPSQALYPIVGIGASAGGLTR